MVVRRQAFLALVGVVGASAQSAAPVVAPGGGGDPLSVGRDQPEKMDPEEAFLGMCGLAQGLGKAVEAHYGMWDRSIESTFDHNCTLAVEMVYIARQHVKDALLQIQQNFTENAKSNPDDNDGLKAAWAAEAVSIAASYATASTHITAGTFNRKGKCLPHELRLLFMVTHRRSRNLALMELKQLWLEFQGTPRDAKIGAGSWINEALSMFEGDARTMQSLIETRGQPEGEIYHYNRHKGDGQVDVIEGMRQDAFKDWPIDKPVLRGILKYGLTGGGTTADFGASSGYVTRWFNKTGLVNAQAYDVIPGVLMATAGAVQWANLTAPAFLPTRYDWITAFAVLDVIPEQGREDFLRNVGRHAAKGAVISWMTELTPDSATMSWIQDHTGLQVDMKFTRYLRSVSDYFGQNVVALRRNEETNPFPTMTQHIADGEAQDKLNKDDFARREEQACGTSRHLEATVYRGHDLEMLEEVETPRACCTKCWTYGGCKYWTHNAHESTCYLKSWKDTIMEGKTGFTSGHYWVNGDPYDGKLWDENGNPVDQEL